MVGYTSEVTFTQVLYINDSISPIMCIRYSAIVAVHTNRKKVLLSKQYLDAWKLWSSWI
jgi:hypothetical protein